MEPTLAPDVLYDRDDVATETESRTVSQAEFGTARDLESHVTVGIVTDAGELLFVADGARGWTLPAVPVGPDAEWADTVHRAVASLTGADADLEDPVRVRRLDFRLEGDPERRHTTYDVLVRTVPLSGRPVADEPTLAGEDVDDLVWLDRLPEDAVDGLAAAVESLLE